MNNFAALKKTILDLHGSVGKAWIQELPELITHCEKRWSLQVLPPFSGLSYNYVAPAVRADGRPVVLKMGVPNPEINNEIEALHVFNGRGTVQLLDSDSERGILLLERLSPGMELSMLDNDEEATAAAAAVMKKIWRPVPQSNPFPSTEKWAEGLSRLRAHYNGGCGPLTSSLVSSAESMFTELFSSSGTSMVLHGDLHHFNILSAERSNWLAVDPKGITGEPSYETGAFLRNPCPTLLQQADAPRILARRVDQFAEHLGFDRKRMLMWGIAQAVLSAWWNIEDQGYGWEYSVGVARVLTRILDR